MILKDDDGDMYVYVCVCVYRYYTQSAVLTNVNINTSEQCVIYVDFIEIMTADKYNRIKQYILSCK